MKTSPGTVFRHASPSAAVLAVLAVSFAAAASADPLEKAFSDAGGAKAEIRFVPGEARPGETVEAVVSVSSPAGISASLPPAASFSDRFEGFEILGSYEDSEGALHFSLAPVPGAERRRLKPFPVSVKDESTVPPAESWFAAGPVAVPEAPPDAAPGTVSSGLRPASIMPSLRGVAKWAGFAAAACAFVALAVFLARRFERAAAVRRLPPKRRALHELDVLLGRDLPGKGRFKDFYSELTLVVRRYVERRHGIRAPRQTTEEFLSAVRGRPEFPRETVGRLGDFLAAADLVKFAGVSATRATAESAASAAREYLSSEPD